ncbi:MAG: hypothetical protein IPP66_04160 [Anaerolineales bacterium]|nr:hypothetical protein [Anaerolineales bacterium]
MIKLYREENSAQANIIEAEFRELVLGYDRIVIGPDQAVKLFGTETALPVITNNERVVSGDEIPAYIKELTRLVYDWRLFQSDSCYVDDNGGTC